MDGQRFKIPENVPRPFKDLLQSKPTLTDTELLNSNNSSPFPKTADVVVAGAGILGLCYAIRLKKLAPSLRIDVFEKSSAPMQKIGESTLSPFSSFLTSEILGYDYVLRLFAIKEGLNFYKIDQNGEKVTCHDIGGVVLTFQLDRRMSELFLTMWAQRMGINVWHGADVDFQVSCETNGISAAICKDPAGWKGLGRTFEAPLTKVTRPSNGTRSTIEPRFVCDASGFSRKLTSKFGKRVEFAGDWNCNAFWAYFKERQDAEVDKRFLSWNDASTKHVCFPEGWGWFIGLISWHHAPLSNLMDLCAYFFDLADGQKLPANEMPTTIQLSELFDCPFERIHSIGWAVRDDYRLPEDLSQYGKGEAEQKFHYFKRKYPDLNKIMDEKYELLPGYYGGKTYFVRKHIAYSSPSVAGDGWFAIGNSTGFTNPLISPGINVGMAGTWLAAGLTRDVLMSSPAVSATFMRSSAQMYQAFIHDFVMPRLDRYNKLWYNSFRDHQLFERIIAAIFSTSYSTVAKYHSSPNYSFSNLWWMGGAGTDESAKLAADILGILDAPTGGAPPSEGQILQVSAICTETIKSLTAKHTNPWGRICRQYDDNLQKQSGKAKRDIGQAIVVNNCPGCNSFVHRKTNMCPVCGHGMEAGQITVV